MLNIIPIFDARWLEFIGNHPDATIFHHPAWSDLLATCYQYNAFAVVRQDATGQILAGFPLMQVNGWMKSQQMVSLPFSDFCQPLCSGEEEMDALVGEIFHWWQDQHQVETRVNWSLPDHPCVYRGADFFYHQTDLKPGFEAVQRSFKPKIARFIRQAERAEVTIRQSQAWEDVLLYYRFHLRTRKRFGVPSQSIRFFRLLWEKVISPGYGFVLLAYQDSRPLGGAIFLHWNNTLTYKYGASDVAYWNLRPNHLLFSHAIRWGCENGYQLFDWGRTDIDDQGLRDFKRGWGAQEQLMHYSILSAQPPNQGPIVQKGMSLMKPVLQHSPVWVSKVIGQLLYGHIL